MLSETPREDRNPVLGSSASRSSYFASPDVRCRICYDYTQHGPYFICTVSFASTVG